MTKNSGSGPGHWSDFSLRTGFLVPFCEDDMLPFHLRCRNVSRKAITDMTVWGLFKSSSFVRHDTSSEHRKPERRITERRIIERRITECRIIERRKLLNAELANVKNYRTSKIIKRRIDQHDLKDGDGP
jgi:hypothetical protein